MHNAHYSNVESTKASKSSETRGDVPDTNQSNKPTAKSEVISFIQTLVVIIACVLFFRGTFIEPFKIPSGSMIPTLEISDYIVVNKLSFGLRLQFITNSLYLWDAPRRGDVVVFTRADDPNQDNFIKRVVGVPGETVEVRGPKLYINGKPLYEPYARWVDGGRSEGNFGPKVVPEGTVFLLGDNRDQSKDARYWEETFLKVERIKGRAFLIWFTLAPGFWSRIGKVIE